MEYINTQNVQKITCLAKKYETSNKGVGYISKGSKWNDPGGDSYGSFQLETKNKTLQEYIHSVDDEFTSSLKKYEVNSDEFKNTWKQLAKNKPIAFEQSQFNYIATKHNGFNDALQYASVLGWNTNSLAMKAAIFSTINQSGGWKQGIFNKACIHKTDNVYTQIHKLYNARAQYFKSLHISKKIIKSSVKSRTIEERRDALKLVLQ
jgi:hypothetical protein